MACIVEREFGFGKIPRKIVFQHVPFPPWNTVIVVNWPQISHRESEILLLLSFLMIQEKEIVKFTLKSHRSTVIRIQHRSSVCYVFC